MGELTERDESLVGESAIGLKVTRYDSEKQSSFFSLLSSSLKNIKDGFGLGRQLAVRDIRAMYRKSLLGLLWAILIPVAQTLIWVLLSKGGVLSVGDTGVPYPLFVLTGIMLWQAFIESLNAPLGMFNSSRSILSKININKEALIIAGAYKVVFNLAIRVVILIPVIIYYGIGISASWLFVPFALLMVLWFGLSLGVLITPIGVLYQDVQRFVQSFSQLFFFLTPIIYPMRSTGFFGYFDKYNPAAISICTARDMLLGIGHFNLNIYLFFCVGVVILSLLGLILYRVSLPIIIERMGS